MKKHIRNDNNKIHLSLVIYDCLVSPQNAIIDVCVSCNQKVSIGMSACNLSYCILHTTYMAKYGSLILYYQL